MFKKIKLYIISLWFLFFILFVIKVNVPIYLGEDYKFVGVWNLVQLNGIALFAFVFMLLGAYFYLNFNGEVTRGATLLPKTITTIKNLNSEMLSFLITYIIPLACLDMDKSRSLIVLILILVLIGWIYIRTNLFYTNPTLAILGFKAYQIDTASTSEMIIIVKNKLVIGDSIYPRKISDNIYYAKK